MIEFRMPSLGADMEEGTLLEWRVGPGDRVRRGDVVALVDTEKAEIEVECWDEGTVEKIVVAVGETVPVGAVLAVLRADGEAVELPQPAPPRPAAPAERPAAIPAPVAVRPATAQEPTVRVRATPRARRLAADRGIDLASMARGGGEITGADLERATPAAPARAAGIRHAIAVAMARSKREIPHYYLETAIDFGAARSWLDWVNRDRPIEQRLLPAAVLVRAVALALREMPDLNGFWVDGGFAPGDGVHLGFAVSLRAGGGLLAPVLRDADRQSVAALMAGLRDRVARARAGRLRSSELSGATCTVTSLGEQGVDKVYGIIHPPQVALVGFGAIREQPRICDGAIAVRPVITATLSADHRASDGQRGARLLARLRALLERPEEL